MLKNDEDDKSHVYFTRILKKKTKQNSVSINLITEAWFKISNICSNESNLTNTHQFLSPVLGAQGGDRNVTVPVREREQEGAGQKKTTRGT